LKRHFQCHIPCSNQRSFDLCFLGLSGQKSNCELTFGHYFNYITWVLDYQMEIASPFFIFTTIHFQWFKTRFNLDTICYLNFCFKNLGHPWNTSFQSVNPLGNVRIHSLALFYICESVLKFQDTFLAHSFSHNLTLIISPRLMLQHWFILKFQTHWYVKMQCITKQPKLVQNKNIHNRRKKIHSYLKKVPCQKKPNIWLLIITIIHLYNKRQ
jgi:hypothetical protein